METTRRKFLTGLVGFVAMPAVVKASSLMPLRGERYDPTLILRDFCVSWWEQLADSKFEGTAWRQRVKRWSDYAAPRVVDVPMAPDAVQVAGVQFDNQVNWYDWSEKVDADPSLAGRSIAGINVRGWRVTDVVQRLFGSDAQLGATGPVIELTPAEVTELIRERETVENVTGGDGFAFTDASLQCSGYYRGEYRGIVFREAHDIDRYPIWSKEEMEALAVREQIRRADLDEDERARLRRVNANLRAFLNNS